MRPEQTLDRLVIRTSRAPMSVRHDAERLAHILLVNSDGRIISVDRPVVSSDDEAVPTGNGAQLRVEFTQSQISGQPAW